MNTSYIEEYGMTEEEFDEIQELMLRKLILRKQLKLNEPNEPKNQRTKEPPEECE